MPVLPFLTPLDAAQLRAAGLPEPWSYGFADRVRFGEIDVLGHVNNAAYLQWFENLRIAYFRDYGLYDLIGSAPKLVLKNIGLDFKAEVKLGDDYILTGRTVEIRRTSFIMQYAVFVRGALTTTGHAVIVNLDDDNGKLALPDGLRTTFMDRDGAIQI